MGDNLSQNVALVTGAARGIGEAIVREMVEEGASVVAVDRDGSALQESLARLGADGRVLGACADITRPDEVAEAVARASEAFGPVDVLVNNAGVSAYFDPVAMTDADWESVLGVDLKGAWTCSRQVIPGMRAAGRGSIVNIASIHARLTVGGMFPYAVAKTGLIGLTRSLALDLAAEGIRVNAVSPGWTRTYLVQEWFESQPDSTSAEASVLNAHPMGRICEPEEIARVVAFVASDKASGLTGAEIPVDAGLGIRMAT
ncbi:short-chain dehydrogenase [Sinomonas atrocyanea]|uniref:Short-chain dehydrogenase n=1 Tax=Sinomonas atrocyanea TaxID=37927 RepID=A0A127A1X7_9MICC|nr:glucose 1-dehydrogenase [Sinomonas atrocyanea]AMM31652.1 short-chain dehydrogenase [Sinomonas atrocyanea]GEB64196.1 short-chain dehydrogenase [Sinomonas atrocyanea]GGG57130.1 short-chain dehydrogenase [Sinomonas atrocyanea]